jgi:hypothetical protein
MNEQTLAFWQLYDQYVQTNTKEMRGELASLLKEIEIPDRKKPLLRPEKGWNKVLAWQVLRNQQFIFSDSVPFCLYAGEMLIQDKPYDRDIFLTRFPIDETISGRLLKHGFEMTHDDRGSLDDSEWMQKVRACGITNEKGLYLPIFEMEVLQRFCKQKVEEMEKGIFSTLHEKLRLL